ncbi:hypothetical protein [Parasphingorhabdus sp.]|uniref:hypothetical protein n=1 Tax=Parasphingorhabdus sp. TaxID=2709688 RepID=UPI003D2999DF
MTVAGCMAALQPLRLRAIAMLGRIVFILEKTLKIQASWLDWSLTNGNLILSVCVSSQTLHLLSKD